MLLLWALLALPLHLLWEIAHLPFYTLWDNSSRSLIAAYVLHCTLGDVMIATAAYGITALLWRRMAWPWHSSVWSLVVLTIIGVSYTLFSEWINVYQLQSWSYAASMPRIAGIGLTPLLQWLIIPTMMLVIFRKHAAGIVSID